MTQDSDRVPLRNAQFLPRLIDVQRGHDGSLTVRNLITPPAAPVHLPALLAERSEQHPDRVWLAQRTEDGEGWQTITYGAAKQVIDRLTQGLLDLRLARPVLAVLSGNSIEHALIAMAAMQAQIAVAPISPAYASGSGTFAKLRSMLDVIRPGAIFVQRWHINSAAISVVADDARIVTADPRGMVRGAVSYEELGATKATDAVATSIAAITPDTMAKLLFTSGSTGNPKAVIHTQQVLCENAAMLSLVGAQPDEGTVPTHLDWLPWSHVMGGNGVFNGVLYEGGTLYIDDGRPTPKDFGKTLRNLEDVRPIRFANVPIGFAMLADALETRPALAAKFFSNLLSLAYAGARLPDEVCARLQFLAIRNTGSRVNMLTGYGATEMGPAGTNVFWATDKVGLIGLPTPGVTLKLCPIDEDRYEVRLRSSGMFTGYLGAPEQTRAVLDEDGFYRTGDAARFVDAAAPEEGFSFAGRTAEEFKLLSGTFVRVGDVRLQLLDACPSLADLVIAAPDRPWLGLLGWLKPERTPEQLNAELGAYNACHPGSSRAIRRAMLLAQLPSLEDGEVTDKGYVNQRRVLERRAAQVAQLYDAPPATDLIMVEQQES